MKKIIERTFFLAAAVLGLFLANNAWETTGSARFFLPLAVTPLALAFFSLTFFSRLREGKVTALGMFFGALTVLFIGIGFWAHDLSYGKIFILAAFLLLVVSFLLLDAAFTKTSTT